MCLQAVRCLVFLAPQLPVSGRPTQEAQANGKGNPDASLPDAQGPPEEDPGAASGSEDEDAEAAAQPGEAVVVKLGQLTVPA